MQKTTESESHKDLINTILMQKALNDGYLSEGGMLLPTWQLMNICAAYPPFNVLQLFASSYCACYHSPFLSRSLVLCFKFYIVVNYVLPTLGVPAYVEADCWRDCNCPRLQLYLDATVRKGTSFTKSCSTRVVKNL